MSISAFQNSWQVPKLTSTGQATSDEALSLVGRWRDSYKFWQGRPVLSKCRGLKHCFLIKMWWVQGLMSLEGDEEEAGLCIRMARRFHFDHLMIHFPCFSVSFHLACYNGLYFLCSSVNTSLMWLRTKMGIFFSSGGCFSWYHVHMPFFLYGQEQWMVSFCGTQFWASGYNNNSKNTWRGFLSICPRKGCESIWRNIKKAESLRILFVINQKHSSS